MSEEETTPDGERRKRKPGRGRRHSFATLTPIRLPHAVADLFADWLERNMPDRRDKVLHRIQLMRGGALNDARFGMRMTGAGQYARQISYMFHIACRKEGIGETGPVLSVDAFRRPDEGQIPLFQS